MPLKSVAPDHDALLNPASGEGEEGPSKEGGGGSEGGRSEGPEESGVSAAAEESQLGSAAGASLGVPGNAGKARFLPAAMLVFR